MTDRQIDLAQLETSLARGNGAGRRPERPIDYAQPRHREAAAQSVGGAGFVELPPDDAPAPLSPEGAALRATMDLADVNKMIAEVGKPYRARLDLATSDWESFQRWAETMRRSFETAARDAAERLAADRALSEEQAALLEKVGRPLPAPAAKEEPKVEPPPAEPAAVGRALEVAAG